MNNKIARSRRSAGKAKSLIQLPSINKLFDSVLFADYKYCFVIRINKMTAVRKFFLVEVHFFKLFFPWYSQTVCVEKNVFLL